MADSHSSSTAAESSPILREVRAKRPWPPDFSKMSELDRYRLERKYKRRARHKGGHPATWMKFTGILQILTITVLPAYMILFMEWPMAHPFEPVRAWMWDKVDYFRGSPARPKAPTTNENRNAPAKESR
ncbi:hypothetical protein TWF694_002047 [Orbilia ellipsospora]|uniref:Transmembrane protein n=1 Tax=Orbilia ellipsospora TaxID=2528407 RepID=A0AAV9X4F3_9PEZI